MTTAARQYPRVEDLFTPRLLQLMGETWEVAEQTVRLCNEPLLAGSVAAEMMFATLARTAALYVVEYWEALDVIVSAGESLMPELPPLPFKRLVIEANGDVGWPIYTMAAERNDDGRLHTMEEVAAYGHEEGRILDAVAIHEDVTGEEWTVCWMMRDKKEPIPGQPYSHKLAQFTLRADGSITLSNGQRHSVDDVTSRLPRRLCVELVHLVTAKGVEIAEVPVPRAQRRRFERSHVVHPSVYYVILDAPSVSASPNTTGRAYSCRWLVRGHWRHIPGGRTWIRTPIKGPAGAPWRGRPVHITNRAVAA